MLSFLVLLALVCASAAGRLNPATVTGAKDQRSDDRSSKAIRCESALSIRGGSSESNVGVGGVDWRYFVAGGACAAFSHGITTPIDVVKTCMQAKPHRYTKGMLSATKTIIENNGVGFLLAGLAPTLVGYGLEGAVKFGSYECLKPVFSGVFKKQIYNYLLASVAAGAIASLVLCPMEEARIKMVGDSSWKQETLLSGLVRLVKEGGILATFGGFPAMLSKQIPYTSGKQVSFDMISKTVRGLFEKAGRGDLTFLISVCAAFITSIIACLVSQPGDMLLTATYKSKRGQSRSLSGVAARIHAQYGLGGFFLGLPARLTHVAFIITSQLVVYDMIKAALGLPVTGSH